MSIKQVTTKDNQTQYLVYVNYRSPRRRNIRAQRKKQCKTKAEAEKWYKILLEEAIYDVSRQEGNGLSFGEIVEAWYSENYLNRSSNLARETMIDYYNAIQTWYRHLLKTPAKEIKKGDIKRVIGKAKTLGKSNSFQRKLKNVVNTIYKWAIEEGLANDVQDSPAKGLSISKKEEKAPEILTVKQARQFLHLAKTTEHPWYPIWATALLTGCRNGELIAMEWSDVNFESNRITISKSWNTRSKEVKSTKAGYYRNVPMNEELRALLLSLYNSPDRHPERVLPQFWPWLKGTQAKILRGFLELHGLPSVKFHTLRACFATMLLEQKIAPITVMKICGWRDLETMQRYVRLAGLDEQGATQDLSLLPDSSLGDIISFTSKENSIH